jgi:hypothetical protein
MAEFWYRRGRRDWAALFIGAILAGSLAVVFAIVGTKAHAKSQAKPATPAARVREALGSHVQADGYAGDVKIDAVAFDHREAVVTARTPDGGFDGPSCSDLGSGAEAIFQKAYDAGAWTGGVRVIFEGGLVERATGQELPHAKTGVFSITSAQATRIEWSSDMTLANVDWSYYEDFCHPALKH